MTGPLTAEDLGTLLWNAHAEHELLGLDDLTEPLQYLIPLGRV